MRYSCLIYALVPLLVIFYIEERKKAFQMTAVSETRNSRFLLSLHTDKSIEEENDYMYTVASDIVEYTFSSSDINFIWAVQYYYCKRFNNDNPVCGFHVKWTLDKYKDKHYFPLVLNAVCCGWCKNKSNQFMQRISLCQILSDDCPQLWNGTVVRYVREQLKVTSCLGPQIKHFKDADYPTTEKSVAMVTKCAIYYNIHHSEPDKELQAQKCEQKEHFTSIDTYLPVTDISSNQTYQNRYCAFCNNIGDARLIKWSPKVECNSHVFSPGRGDRLIEKIKEHSYCNLLFIPPKNITFETCDYKISNCNITGRWERFDAVVEAACEALRLPFQGIYKNVFCFLCNINKSTLEVPHFKCPYFDERFTLFSMVLRLESFDNQDHSDARPDVYNKGRFYDSLQNKYLELICLFPNMYKADSCETFAYSVGDVAFEMFLKLTPTEQMLIDVLDDVHDVHMYLKTVLNRTGLSSAIVDFDIYFRKGRLRQDGYEYIVARIVLLFHYDISSSPKRDISLVGVLMKLHGKEIYVPATQARNYTSCAYNIELDIFDFNTTESLSPGGSGNTNSANIKRIYDMTVDSYKNEPRLMDHTGKNYLKSFGLAFVYPNAVEYSDLKVPMITLSPVRKCPAIKLRKDFYQTHVTGSKLYIELLNKSLHRNQFVVEQITLDWLGKSNTYICKDLYESLISEHRVRNNVRSIRMYVGLALFVSLAALYIVKVIDKVS